jgi:hypothetical protein
MKTASADLVFSGNGLAAYPLSTGYPILDRAHAQKVSSAPWVYVKFLKCWQYCYRIPPIEGIWILRQANWKSAKLSPEREYKVMVFSIKISRVRIDVSEISQLNRHSYLYITGA